MRKKLNKGIIFILWVLTLQKSIAHPKLCEIKYGETEGEINLEKKYFNSNFTNNDQRKYRFDCYQIGVEHDELMQAIPEKPIYTCCKKYLN